MASVLYLTVHKAASNFALTKFLPQLAQWAGYEYIHPGKAYSTVDHFAARDRLVLGPVRMSDMVAEPQLFDDWKKVLLLRDPRDMLTSFYFSISQSHPLPADPALREKMLAKRELARSESIDQAVLRMAPNVAPRYFDYMERLAPRPNLLLVRYEDMVTDWQAFAARVGDFLDEPWCAAFWDSIRPAADEFRVAENPAAHKRQVLPGDHVRKLQPETIAALTKEFEPVLSWLGYAH